MNLTEKQVTARALPILTGGDGALSLWRTGVGDGYHIRVRDMVETRIASAYDIRKDRVRASLKTIWARCRTKWGVKGWPDYSGFYAYPAGLRPIAAYVEMKSTNGRLEPEQREQLAMLAARRAFTGVVASEEDARGVLRALEAGEGRYGW